MVPELVRAMEAACRAGYGSVARRFSDRVSYPRFDFEEDARRALADESRRVNRELRAFQRQIDSNKNPRTQLTELRRRYDRLGVGRGDQYALEGVFRTQAEVTFHGCKFLAEQETTANKQLWGYKYVTMRDERVRDSHRPLHGVTLPKEDPFWRTYYPPNGHRCRCVAVPRYRAAKIVEPGPLPDLVPEFSFNVGELFT